MCKPPSRKAFPASSPVLLATLAVLAVAQSAAAATARTGKEIVETVCAACHASGKDGAPMLGDQAEWAKRASKGLASVTENAIRGVKKMPAHGGQANLSDLEMSRAVAYMISNGRTQDPNKAYASPQETSGKEIVAARCQECHATGKNGAPKIGDVDAWKPRLKNGVAPLVSSAISGHNSMPARGGLGALSDAEMRSAVIHMVNQISTQGK